MQAALGAVLLVAGAAQALSGGERPSQATQAAQVAVDPPPLWAAPPSLGVRVAEVTFEGVDPKGLRALVVSEDGAPLDPRDVRDAIRSLYATARFARVAAYLEVLEEDPRNPGSRGRLVFVLALVQKLVSLSFPGGTALAESILHQTANLQTNAEFQPEQLPRAAEAIRAAYYRIGYRRAKVTPVRNEVPGGISLELRIDEGPATLIAEVRFSGDFGIEQSELAAAFKLEPGDVLNLGALEEGVRGVRERYRRAGRLRARVEMPIVEELSETRARLTVPVQAGPEVRFHLRGNVSFSDSLLVSRLGDDSDQPLDAQAEADMASRLRRFYLSQGFFRVTIAQRELRAKDGAAEVVFSIDEGTPMRVEEIRFTGNKGIPSGQLRERVTLLLGDSVQRDAASGVDPGEVALTGVMGKLPDPPRVRYQVDPVTVFDPVVYARALKQIEDLYKSEGYLSARVGPPKLVPLDPLQRRVAVELLVAEGDRTLVSRIVVEGGGDVPAPEVDAAIVLRKGFAFSYLAAEEGRAALTQIFTRRGHLYAKVEDEESFLDEEGSKSGISRVEVRYRIQPGPVVRVGFVEVVGQRRTIEGLILDLVGLKSGDVLTPEVLDRGQQALLRTGLFFSATLTPRDPEVAEPEKTVQVVLRERPTRDFQANLGFSLADGPRASAQWTQGNLLGRNLTFTAFGKIDYPFLRYQTPNTCPVVPPDPPGCASHFAPPEDSVERVIDLGFSVPRLYPLIDSLRAGVDLIHERAVRQAYYLTKYSAQASLGLTRRRPISVDLAYEAGFQFFSVPRNVALADRANVDPRIFRLPEGKLLFGSLRPTLVMDLRDDPVRPRSGFLAQLSGDYLRSFPATELYVNLMKVQGLLAAYVPLPLLSSLVLSVRGGRIFQLSNSTSAVTPGDRRFYLGGATSLRGFNEDGLQPQDLIDQLHREVTNCEHTLSGVACSNQSALVASGGASNGGNQLIALGAELRVPFAQTWELALFYDAGNLWNAPTSILTNLVLRDAVGVGLRWLTPIGRMAIDLGMNLTPDNVLGEPRFGPYFSIDPL